MVNTLYSLAEQCNGILGDRVDPQSLIAAVTNAYASVAQKAWYESRASDVNEIDGVFLVPFKNITPILDLGSDMYYINNPSSYVRLPCEYGINFVGHEKAQTSGFLRITAGSLSIWSNLKAYTLGGRQTYYTEGTRTYFPKMTSTTNGNIMVRYAVAFDGIDPEEDLQIPPNVAGEIVDIVVAKFTAKPPVTPENLN